MIERKGLSMSVASMDERASGRGSERETRERAVLRLHADDKQRADYWADRRGYSSTNEYMAEAVIEKIRRENFDYDLPTLEIARMNQLVDEVAALSRNQANLERVMTSGFDAIIGLTRGENYLRDQEEGQL